MRTTTSNGHPIPPEEPPLKQPAHTQPPHEEAHDPPTPSPPPQRSFSLDTVRTFAFLAAVYLYFAGFVYREFFAHTLGIPSGYNVPIYSYIIYSYFALAGTEETPFGIPAWWVIGFMTAVTAIPWGFQAWAEWQQHTRLSTLLSRFKTVFLSSVAVLLFPVIYRFAHAAGVQAAVNPDPGTQEFFKTHVTVTYQPGAAAAYGNACIGVAKNVAKRPSPLLPCFLVSQTNDAYYVFYKQFSKAPAKVVEIPKTDVAHITTIVDQGDNQ